MWLITRFLLAGVIGIALGVWIGFSKPPVANAPAEPVPAILETPIAATTTPAVVAAATTTPPKPKPVNARKPASATSTPPAPTPILPPTPAPILPLPSATSTESTSDKVRDSLVNIVCTAAAGSGFDSISASGVIIDGRGVILTNSHVAQFLLLKDYPSPGYLSCVVRTGSPAYPRYTAELLFVAPDWISQNAYKITETEPLGNGEHDYALLRITGTVSSSVQMPASFPFLHVSTDPPVQSENVLVAAYPAGFLGGITIATSLYAASANSHVGDVYTFGGNTLDLFSVGGTVVDQQGSSGGAVTDQNGTLLGLIVTATQAADTSSRDLRAIATSYIIGDFQKEAGVSLESYLEGDIAAEAHAFQNGTAPTLRQDLVNALESAQ